MTESRKFNGWDAADAIPFVKKHEGCELTSYRCPAGVWTIGYGSTRLASGNPVIRNITITQAEADALLRKELDRIQDEAACFVRVPVTHGQFVALMDFAYNCGVSALERSTLIKQLNAGKPVNAAYEFKRWTRAGGKELPGLVRRREDEKSMFLS